MAIPTNLSVAAVSYNGTGIPLVGIVPSGTTQVNVTQNGTTTEDVTNYATLQVIASVPNSYSAEDEGKVVNNGSLYTQGSSSVTANDTYDTTLINSLTVNVPTSGGKTTGTIQISATEYDNIFIPFPNANTNLHCLKIYSGGFNAGDDLSGAPYGTYKRFLLMLDVERNIMIQCMINYAGTGYAFDGNVINFGSSTSANYVALTSSGITLNRIRFGGAAREWLQTDEDYIWEAW